jgi:hypothetical protein
LDGGGHYCGNVSDYLGIRAVFDRRCGMSDDLKARMRRFDPHMHELEVVDEAADYIELALTISRAETAAAYERAAIAAHDKAYMGAHDAIRALATPDQSAALDAVRAEARAQGMREAADLIRPKYERIGNGVAVAAMHRGADAILASIKGSKA